MQDPLFFVPVLINKISVTKLNAYAKYQTGTIANNGVSHKALGILPAFFHWWSTINTRLLQNKKYLYTVLYQVLLYCRTTVLQYFKLLLYCVPGTASCTTTSVLYY